MMMTIPGIWREFFATTRGWAETSLREDGRLRPGFVIFGTNTALMPSGWTNAEERQRAIRMAQLVALVVQAKAVAFMGETWFLVDEEDRTNEPDFVAPSKRSNRREGLCVNFGYRVNRTRHWFGSLREIERGADGAITGFGEDHGLTPGSVHEGGILAHILPPKPVPDHLAQVVRAELQKLGVNLDDFAPPPKGPPNGHA